MGNQEKTMHLDWLLMLLGAYCAASLLHYVHNAVFLDEYPNMPAWLSPARVYGAWLGVTAIGILGYVLVHRGYRLPGLALLALYGVIGFDGLGHYRLAPLSAHTLTMNLTIWLEAVTALLVLVAVARMVVQRLRAGAAARF